jgi:2-polyprenyl-3-methyl-5-hydroxy-6-metoxy-1,4-benzoquinol methylase
MDPPESEIVRKTLERPDVHARWIRDFYTDESTSFYDAAFDLIASRLAPREHLSFLDAGCGDGAHTVRLAKRGYPVVALDFSEHILSKARENVAANNLEHMVRFEHGNLLKLPIADDSFDFVLCWGVLMHIPEVETAITELARVVKPNGFLIISENNMWSLESLLVRAVRSVLGRAVLTRLRGKEPAELRITPAGAEYWRQTDAGPLICREARISWLIARVASHGFVFNERVATEFTELPPKIPVKMLKRWLWKFNLMWFKYVRLPQPAVANLLLFKKTGACRDNRH